MLSQHIVNIVYLVAAVLFILDLKWMAHPRTAVRGNRAGALGMALAIAVNVMNDFIISGPHHIMGKPCNLLLMFLKMKTWYYPSRL